MPKQINTKVVTRTRRELDSIKYTLNEATELLSFPFVFNELLTPDSLNTQLGRHLLSYKKNIHVVAQIRENYWNNNKYLQLDIKDLFIELN